MRIYFWTLGRKMDSCWTLMYQWKKVRTARALNIEPGIRTEFSPVHRTQLLKTLARVGVFLTSFRSITSVLNRLAQLMIITRFTSAYATILYIKYLFHEMY
jgi:hypothetical protein